MPPETGPAAPDGQRIVLARLSALACLALLAAGLSRRVRRRGQGEQRLMIGGLDERYESRRIARQCRAGPRVDAEPGGSRDAQPGEIVPDVGRPGDLRGRGQARRAAALSRASRSGEPSGSAYGGHEVVTSTPVCGVPGHAVRFRDVLRSNATAASPAPGEPDIDVEGAQVRDRRITLPAADPGDGKLRRQRNSGRRGQAAASCSAQISAAALTIAGTGLARPRMPAMPCT